MLKYADDNGILTNIRGSVAGSMTTYLLKITKCDPLIYQIPFERFLNPERPSAPDIDMDYADDRRDEMIDYVRNKYGENNFKYEIIEECEKGLLLIREKYNIDLLDCYNNGYNIAIPANCVMLGRNHSEKTKEILREKSKGNKNMLGKKHTEQTKNKIKEKLK